MRTIVAHRVSTVVVNTVGNLSAVNIPAGSFGVVSTGNLNAMARREFERHGYPRREFGGGEYPRREYRRGEYGERGGYGKYRD